MVPPKLIVRPHIAAYIVSVCLSGFGATYPAASPNDYDVAAAIALATNGDTVRIPAGTAYWQSGVTVMNKGITISGAGTNSTFLVDNMTNRVAAPPMMNINWSNTTPGTFFRLTGVQFQAYTNATPLFDWVSFTGGNALSNNSIWRIDNCFWQSNDCHAIYATAFNGLIDHCYFNVNGAGGCIAFDTWWNFIANGDYGDASWNNPVLWGTVNAVYVEDCYFTNTFSRAATDAYAGARFVVRHCSLNNITVQNHGTESSGRIRGARSYESYNNTFFCPTISGGANFFRSGTAVVFSNATSGSWPALIIMDNYRNTAIGTAAPWWKADGTNVWDTNYPTLYASGINTSSTTANTVTDTNQSWTANQWVGYSIINLEAANGGDVISNTANSITVDPAEGIFWTNGNHYEVHKIYQALDQPGTGLCNPITNNPPQPVGWPNQTIEPIYYWANTGVVTNASANRYEIIAGLDFTNIAKPGYTPLAYPHPFIALTQPVASPTIGVSGLMIISGSIQFK